MVSPVCAVTVAGDPVGSMANPVRNRVVSARTIRDPFALTGTDKGDQPCILPRGRIS
jgi:hypothetical protein